ncbi:TPA: glycosyltransferase family 2 protein [Escherichia coli]|nr:glycosyltransferase family 2 protein [Escherichia coli]HBB8469380.1 glycosyltransferase family 2 protein [Escherichia coli]HDS0585812.1 glycosyltransferase family 2 protein [Escherichia coli]
MLSICSIFKNEHQFILEWLAYHRCLGIKHYYIADNTSTDGSKELLIALSKIGIVEYFDYPTEAGTAPQIGAYNTLLSKAETEWLTFIDADEFLTPVNYEESLTDLYTLLNDERVSAVALNWAVYGSSCSIIPENALVVERLNKRANKEHSVNRHYKSIVRKKDTISAGKNPHHFILKDNKKYVKTTGYEESESDGLSKQVDWDKLRVNHYVIKSKAEFINKKAVRGRATTLEKDLNRTINFFRSHDLNQVEDNIPRWFINRVVCEKKLLVEKLKNIGYHYSEQVYLSPLYRTACGMGKGNIDILNIFEETFEIRGWAINKNLEPVEHIIAIINSINILEPINSLFRDRLDLARANLGSGIGSGFNVTFTLPKVELKHIDFYGLDSNGLVVVEIKSTIDLVSEINKKTEISFS